ncbi:MAG: ABC transporter ATP-binding protein [Lachnospiraceae bacterium]|nr:ABC transporter ATP-binding protein [Lachnospiraceae bacterium]
MNKDFITFEHITKSFDGETVLDDLCLNIKENEFMTLLGPSGCGKTTTLRLLGGFETPDSGKIFFDGKDITTLAPNERKLNTVFQKYALFPHMSIAENIAFGLKISKKSKAYIDDKIKYALKLVNLDGFEHRSVDSLSGGQQQRIAIARAIVNEPKVLLLDEPLGALDLKLRQDMQYELIRLKNELGITFLYVTHDQEEALTMSDSIVVMNQGYIQQIGTPEDIYNEPVNAFVADFIGDSNIIDGIMLEDRMVEILGTRFPCVDEGFGKNQPVDVVIRPEDVELVAPEDGIIQGVVSSIIFKGVHYEIEVKANGFEWLVHTTKLHEVGSQVGIQVIPFNIQIMHKPESSDEEATEIDD